MNSLDEPTSSIQPRDKLRSLALLLALAILGLAGCGGDEFDGDEFDGDEYDTDAALADDTTGDVATETQALADGQVGFRGVIVPRCPDCDGRGNVCRSAEFFYPGLVRWIAERDLRSRCRQANALDFCGGSRACVRLNRAEQDRHRARNGGGCYQQCSTAPIIWIIENR